MTDKPRTLLDTLEELDGTPLADIPADRARMVVRRLLHEEHVAPVPVAAFNSAI